ncbi:MAG: methylated-DNA--[protein]-cysteine S-methyltransferase [Dehalococcoidaceae bacterium]|nr:methylated-DNA--[protein]-cysteine S-methyltransferase [Dehalococcoidaceae bacterium]
MGILATGTGIRRLALPRPDRRLALEDLGDLSDAMYDEDRFDELARKLKAYFKAEPVVFDEALDVSGYTPFMRSVWQSARHVGYGETASYGEIASSAFNPRAFRAVGQAMKRNPVPLIIPCHRIIRTDGSMGGFFGGEHIKQGLLELEKRGLTRLRPD